MPVTERLAIWAAQTPDIRAAEPLSKARDAVLDTIGCIVAGASDEAARAVGRAVSDWGDGPCTVIGQSARLAAPWAAMANGTAAHALDFVCEKEETGGRFDHASACGFITAEFHKARCDLECEVSAFAFRSVHDFVCDPGAEFVELIHTYVTFHNFVSPLS